MLGKRFFLNPVGIVLLPIRFLYSKQGLSSNFIAKIVQFQIWFLWEFSRSKLELIRKRLGREKNGSWNVFSKMQFVVLEYASENGLVNCSKFHWENQLFCHAKDCYFVKCYVKGCPSWFATLLTEIVRICHIISIPQLFLIFNRKLLIWDGKKCLWTKPDSN